jgi:hypothetical protein
MNTLIATLTMIATQLAERAPTWIGVLWDRDSPIGCTSTLSRVPRTYAYTQADVDALIAIGAGMVPDGNRSRGASTVRAGLMLTSAIAIRFSAAVPVSMQDAALGLWAKGGMTLHVDGLTGPIGRTLRIALAQMHAVGATVTACAVSTDLSEFGYQAIRTSAIYAESMRETLRPIGIDCNLWEHSNALYAATSAPAHAIPVALTLQDEGCLSYHAVMALHRLAVGVAGRSCFACEKAVSPLAHADIAEMLRGVPRVGKDDTISLGDTAARSAYVARWQVATGKVANRAGL